MILRGRGDCEFERANESLGIDGGTSWTVAFSAMWEGSNELPTMAFGDYLEPDRQSCADSRLLRPAAAGDRYAPPVALTPGYCTLSILFSDWQRTGQRDLRMTNDRHYYRDGTDQLWRMAPDATPTPVHRGRRLAPAADLGHGHRQPGRHRRRPAGGLPHEPGRQQAPNARRRRHRADVRGHRVGERGHRPPPLRRRRRAPVDRLARRVPGRQQRRLRRSVRVQGQRRGAARVRHP